MRTPTMQALDAKIPDTEIDTRSQAGVTLSYLTGHYVINRLNQVLGQGNWSYAVEKPTLVFEGKVTQGSGKEVFAVSYTAQCSLMALIDGKTVQFTDIGYGDGTDARNPGKAHELAVKEAATDAIKRAAKNLGISMGLGLYFKDGEYIENTTTPIRPVKPAPVPPIEGPKTAAVKPTVVRKAPTRDLVKAAYSVLSSQGKINAVDFRNKYLQTRKIDELDDAAVEAAFQAIKTDFTDLAL